MTAASAVSICSNALIMLGSNPISDFSEDSARARSCANLWPTVRDFALRRHPWNCAVRRVSLPPDAAAPAFDWTWQFTLPSDCLRVLSVGERGCEEDFKLESGKLLCDANPALVRYIWRNENPAAWDAMLVYGMTVLMRTALAYNVTQSTSLEQQLEVVMRDVLKQARAVDGQEEPPEALGDSPLLHARLGGRAWRA